MDFTDFVWQAVIFGLVIGLGGIFIYEGMRWWDNQGKDPAEWDQ